MADSKTHVALSDNKLKRKFQKLFQTEKHLEESSCKSLKTRKTIQRDNVALLVKLELK
jgi:hypothetical protein